LFGAGKWPDMVELEYRFDGIDIFGVYGCAPGIAAGVQIMGKSQILI
jgi:hypothetical protein